MIRLIGLIGGYFGGLFFYFGKIRVFCLGHLVGYILAPFLLERLERVGRRCRGSYIFNSLFLNKSPRYYSPYTRIIFIERYYSRRFRTIKIIQQSSVECSQMANIH